MEMMCVPGMSEGSGVGTLLGCQVVWLGERLQKLSTADEHH